MIAQEFGGTRCLGVDENSPITYLERKMISGSLEMSGAKFATANVYPQFQIRERSQIKNPRKLTT